MVEVHFSTEDTDLEIIVASAHPELPEIRIKIRGHSYNSGQITK
jgi:hypothetical protein